MSLLEVFWGPSPFKLVLEHTMKVHECVELLRPLTEALLAGNYGEIKELHRRMSKTEHDADIIKARIRQRLSEVYLLSVRREELNRFISVQDDVADSAEDYSVVLLLRNTKIPPKLKEDFLAFVEQVIKVSEHLLKIAGELSVLAESAFAGEEAKRVFEAFERIGEEEWTADKLQRKFALHFYSMEDRLDPVTLMFLDKYCYTLSTVANSAEKASKYLRQIITN
jgi:predicted phosphate transport protein (TIGR00153 family)